VEDAWKEAAEVDIGGVLAEREAARVEPARADSLAAVLQVEIGDGGVGRVADVVAQAVVS
jgi:hypothetical protein